MAQLPPVTKHVGRPTLAEILCDHITFTWVGLNVATGLIRWNDLVICGINGWQHELRVVDRGALMRELCRRYRVPAPANWDRETVEAWAQTVQAYVVLRREGEDGEP